MNAPPLTIIPWPATSQILQAAFNEGRGLIVIGIRTPHSTIRKEARERVRQALHQILGTVLDCPPETIELISQPGQPLRLAAPHHQIGLSVTHEPGLSLAAIHQHGVVGIDLMRIDEQADWLIDWEDVANLYLGQRARVRIAKESPERRANAFAKEWTRLEASLKCHGLPLSESNPALEKCLDRCRLIALDLPSGMAGTIAILPSGSNWQ